MRYLLPLFLLLLFLSAHATNRALIIGIGDYNTEKTGWGKLHGDKDVELLVKTLAKKDFKKENISTLTNEEATKSAMLKSLRELADKTQEGDIVIFHFSGHGQPVLDLNGDEENGYDESIIPYDAYRSPRYQVNGSFYKGENHLIDDELYPLFNEIKRKVGKKGYFLVSIDACYSRGIEMDALGELTPQERERAGTVRGTDHKFKADKTGALGKVAKPGVYVKEGRMAVITACREDEQNLEYVVPVTKETFGSLSYSLANLLNRGLSFPNIENYFQEGKYVKDKIFVTIQHPKIKVY